MDRVVLIHDETAANTQASEAPGDMTGLLVLDAPKHQDEDGEVPTRPQFTQPSPAMVSDGGRPGAAINFASVDGLLVYDDSLFRQYTGPDKRQFLIDTARPMYISPQTGAIIRGPLGESTPPRR